MIIDEKGLQIVDSNPNSITHYSPEERARKISMEEAAVHWLETKRGKSNSTKTEKAYKDVLGMFKKFIEKTGSRLDDDPREVARLAQIYAKTSTPIIKRWLEREEIDSDEEELAAPGRELSTSTINQRFAVLSSYYQFAMKHGACDHNPIEYSERPSRRINHAAKYLDKEYVAEALRMIDTTTLEGKRDYALVAMAVMTGRRAAELAGLCWGDLLLQGNKLTLTWRRCKGNKTMHNIVGGVPSEDALIRRLYTYISALYGPLDSITDKDAPIFVSLGNRKTTRKDGSIAGLSHQAISNIFLARLGVSQVHTSRHTFAVNMHENGATIQEIGDLLGHSNYNVTAEYLKKQLQAVNKHLGKLGDAFGID